MTVPRRVAVIACGEQQRGDDGVAAMAVAGLPSAVRALADVLIVGALDPDDLLSIAPGRPLVIVDAVAGIPAGRLIDLDLDELIDGRMQLLARSTHALPLETVVALADALRPGCARGTFLGVGVADVSVGGSLSLEVRRAVPGLRAALCAEIQRLATEPAGHGRHPR